MREKIKARDDLIRIIEDLKASGKKVVFTNGVFDLLHVGHVRYLEDARAQGDVLVVAVNSDRSVRALKGPHRPVLSQDERAEVLSGLGCVDYITIFDEETPHELISSILPHVLVKGGDWTKDDVVGRDLVERSGGEVLILPFHQGTSTTTLIQRILKRYEKGS